MANSIEFAKSYTGILDEVYQRAAVSRCLNSGGRIVRAGRNAKEILIPKISVTGLGDYTRNVGYKTGSITYEYKTHSFKADMASLSLTNMNYWLYGLTAITSVTGWANLSNVASMRYAMNGCTGVTTLDLRGMDPSSLTDPFYAFAGCSALTTIYADSTWALPGKASGSGTFYNCRNIVGGNGTIYSTSAYGHARMVVDRVGQVGYLTAA